MRKLFRKTITARQIIIWAIAITFVLSGAVISYAERYYELRNDDISLDLPDDWECDEIDEEFTDDMDCEQIAVAHDNSGKSELAMDMYYSDDDVGEYEWFYIGSDADGVMEYFDKYGKAAVERLYEEICFGSVSIGEPGVFEGDYNNFLTVPVNAKTPDGTATSDVVYLTCDMTDDDEEVIHKMLRFYNADGASVTESETEVIGSIVNNFRDIGYGDDSEPYYNDYNDDDYDSDSDAFGAIIGFIVLVIPLVIVVVIIVKVVNKKKNAFEASTESSRSRSKDDFSAGFRKKRSDFEKQKYRRTHDNVKPNEHPHDHIRPSNAEERYMESLRTLRKSGLLTKEEMQDMFERHERNKMYKSQ